jgi:[amino group carrier protein]-lysine/ornithine hydrolase
MSATVEAALDPVALLDELLGTPSVTGSTDAAAARLVEATRAAGFASHVDAAGNVVMCWGDGAATSDILLIGHLDTVPGDLPVRLHEGRLYGRGSVDAKGPLAAALAAVSALPAQGAPITVVAACDEEGPSLGARHLRARAAPSALVVLEPSGWNTVTTGYRGCVRLRAAIERSSAHHAAPEPAAADLLVAALAQLQERLGSRGGASARDGGRAVDAIQLRINALRTVDREETEVAEAAVEIRLPIGTPVDAVLSTVTQTLGDACIEVDSECEAVRVPRGNPVVRGLARAVTAEGGRPRYTTKTGTCDLNVVWPAWRCDAAVYGPGDSSLDHTPRESMDVDDLRRGAAVLRHAIAGLR